MVRKFLLAALAAWIIGLPSAADAQQRGERERPRVQHPQQDVRRGGGFSGMLRDIAGARLDRARAAQRSGRPQPQQGGGGRRR